ncbi:MAG: type II/IV secretion system ATPase subunit, partial [Nitrososphaerota archaeon]|nr:type II/IV secretion system ATPase subunit [Nitrososphaerota archaeon]
RVIDQRMAAYFWLLMENKATALVVGSTGSGKTTLLNALLTMTRTNAKIVTIEEVQEVNIPHFNWTALLSRENYAASTEVSSQVNLFDLVKAAMRMRPDIIVVGEVRGEEAYVLFQAISTGHGGTCTIHADDVESAIQRLTSKPMDVPPAFIPFLDLAFTVRRISIPNPGGGFRAVRRIVSVDEVSKVGEYFNVFKWNPANDSFRASEIRGSPKLNRLSKDLGVKLSDVTEELNRRAVVLRWLQERGVRNFREVSAVLEDYAARPGPVFQKAVKELGIASTPEAIAGEGFKL